MFGPKLDARMVDQLLERSGAPEDAPQGYAEVASLLWSAASPPMNSELEGRSEAVQVAVRSAGFDRELRSLTEPRRHTRMHAHRSRLKIVGVAVGTLLLSTGGLAWAGSLPGPAQDAVSNVLDTVGVSVPASDHPSADHPEGDQPSVGHPSSTGAEVSGIATTTDATGVAKGAQISDIASGGASQAGDHGGAASSTGSGSGTSPDSGTGLADTSSGGASDVGSGTADQDSADHSADGAGNADVAS
jgi:hypothetical protein